MQRTKTRHCDFRQPPTTWSRAHVRSSSRGKEGGDCSLSSINAGRVVMPTVKNITARRRQNNYSMNYQNQITSLDIKSLFLNFYGGGNFTIDTTTGSLSLCSCFSLVLQRLALEHSHGHHKSVAPSDIVCVYRIGRSI